MYQQATYESLNNGDLFSIGQGTNVYAKKGDGEYILVKPGSDSNVQVGSLYVARETTVNVVFQWKQYHFVHHGTLQQRTPQ